MKSYRKSFYILSGFGQNWFLIHAVVAPCLFLSSVNSEEIRPENYTYGVAPTSPYIDNGGQELIDGQNPVGVWPNQTIISPLVGWANIAAPTVSFNFDGKAVITSVTVWLSDSDGDAGVGLPSKVTLSTPGGFEKEFAVQNPPGSGSQIPVVLSGFEIQSSSITLKLTQNAENPWIMVSEVKFEGTRPVAPENRFYDFNGANLPGGFSEQTTTTGFSATMTGSGLRLNKAVGPTEGRVFIQSMFFFGGDFDVAATINRGSGNSSKGLSVQSESGNVAQNIYCTSGNRLLVSTNSESGGFIGQSGGLSAAQMKMRISRQGNTVTSWADTDAGWQIIFARNNVLFGQPFNLTLFSLMETGSSDADTFEIQDLTMEFERVAGTLPLPPMNIHPGVELELPTYRLNRYQLEYSENLSSGQWFSMGAPLQGAEGSLKIFDLSKGFSKRFYRSRLVD